MLKIISAHVNSDVMWCDGQNLLSVTKVIWWSPMEKIVQTFFEIKNKKEFQSATSSNINEVIKAVLNFLFFFTKTFHMH